jgi:phosphoglycolate phosphatase-like HAD superfamily hydrolase
MAAAAPTPSSTSIWAFDFDGVLVDSARETGMAGWKGCEALFGSAAPAEKVAELLEQFALVRPILETGWEAVLLVHLLHTGTLVEALLTHFQSSLKASTMVAVGKSQAEIMAAFKTARTMWIASDVEGWLGTNRFYTTAVQAVQSLVAASSDTVKVYIITTKAKEFAVKLLAACNIAVPEERVFGLGSGRKGAVLSQIIAEHTVNGGAVRYGPLVVLSLSSRCPEYRGGGGGGGVELDYALPVHCVLCACQRCCKACV